MVERSENQCAISPTPLTSAKKSTRMHVESTHPPSPLPGLLNHSATAGPENLHFLGDTNGQPGPRATRHSTGIHCIYKQQPRPLRVLPQKLAHTLALQMGKLEAQGAGGPDPNSTLRPGIPAEEMSPRLSQVSPRSSCSECHFPVPRDSRPLPGSARGAVQHGLVLKHAASGPAGPGAGVGRPAVRTAAPRGALSSFRPL